MLKKIAALAVAAPLALTLAACSGGNASNDQKADGGSTQAAEQKAAHAKDFDGSKYAETEAGAMYLATAAGTSKDGNVPQVKGDGKSLVQIELDAEGFNGEACTIYVDGMKSSEANVGRMQTTISLTGDQLSKGEHTVELVSMDGDAPVIYKLAKYEIV